MFLLAGSAIVLVLITAINLDFIDFDRKTESQANETQITQNSEKIIKKLSPTNTPTPTFAPTPTTVPTPTKTPTKAPTATPEKQQSNIPANTTDTSLTLMNQINNFRATKGLAPLSTDGYTCAFATLRAQEIVGSFSHSGFDDRISNNSLPYPSYSSVAENIAMNSDPNQVVQKWIESAGHNENMSKDVPYGCVGKSGNYYAFEAWKP